jgi:hypothetical protein
VGPRAVLDVVRTSKGCEYGFEIPDKAASQRDVLDERYNSTLRTVSLLVTLAFMLGMS